MLKLGLLLWKTALAWFFGEFLSKLGSFSGGSWFLAEFCIEEDWTTVFAKLRLLTGETDCYFED